MGNIILKWFIPFAVSMVFFVIVFTTPGYFNTIPSTLYEVFLKGSNKESEFIFIFDVVTPIFIFSIACLIMNYVTKHV